MIKMGPEAPFDNLVAWKMYDSRTKALSMYLLRYSVNTVKIYKKGSSLMRIIHLIKIYIFIVYLPS